ncbi:MAG: hypothetical protein RTU63_07815 [Candidatus Thorarchaeota archaeon]
MQISDFIETIPEEFRLLYLVGAIGFVLALVLTILLYPRKDTSSTAKALAAGSALAFHVGGFNFLIATIFVTSNGYMIRISPIGFVGAYLLIVLSLVQFWHDRKKASIDYSQ